jgi:5'-deoxynucleotidase YfbR-like HD superfamily hydrolase
MNNLTDLFKIMQLTRSMPQYGYVVAGIKQNDLSNLAEHHYLVTFIAWQLALILKDKGAQIDVLKVLEISLVHDVGELFGGDLSFHYGRAHKVAREKAKAFEKENVLFLSKFFPKPEKFLELNSLERGDILSDEAIISRFADLVECIYYKITLDKVTPKDMDETIAALRARALEAKDDILKKELLDFLGAFSTILDGKSTQDIIWQHKD